jgi:hypothetical protein
MTSNDKVSAPPAPLRPRAAARRETARPSATGRLLERATHRGATAETRSRSRTASTSTGPRSARGWGTA